MFPVHIIIYIYIYIYICDVFILFMQRVLLDLCDVHIYCTYWLCYRLLTSE